MEVYHSQVRDIMENLIRRGFGISPFAEEQRTTCLPGFDKNAIGFVAQVPVNYGYAKLRFDVFALPEESSLCVAALDIKYRGSDQHSCHQWCGNHAYVNLLCERQRHLAFPPGTQYDKDWVEAVTKPRELDDVIAHYLMTIDSLLSNA